MTGQSGGGVLEQYQQAFVDAVERDPEGTVRVLVAPPGTGKTRTVVELILHWRHRNAGARVLVITDRAILAEQYLHALSATPISTTSLQSRRDWRQWQLSHPDVERTGFEHVVVATVRLAQDERALQAMGNTPWDLIVVDEVPKFHTKDGLLATVRAANPTVKIVLLDQMGASEFRNHLPESRITRWTVRPMRTAALWRELRYVPSDPEERFREALTLRFLDPLRAGGFQREASFVEALARSSVLAVETVLRQLRPFRNRFVHPARGDTLFAAREALTVLRRFAREEGFDIEDTPDEPAGAAPEFGPWEAALVSVASFDELLDGITRDAKFEALAGLIFKYTTMPTIVLTSFQSTARYLRSALREHFATASSQEGSTPDMAIVVALRQDETMPDSLQFERAVYYDVPPPSTAPPRFLGASGAWEQWVLVGPGDVIRPTSSTIGSLVEVVES